MNDETHEPTEAELRAAFEEQMRNVGVEDVILQTVATLVNLGARRLGLVAEPGEDPAAVRDVAQARLAIDGARALAPLCPDDHQDSIRQALSQLQLAFAREAQGDPEAGQPDPAAAGPDPAGGGKDAGTADPAAPPPAGDDAAERAKARSQIWTPPGA
ncbi:MAG: hypothetical protein ACR2GL_06415 [Thermoleophilaceae bacterium]